MRCGITGPILRDEFEKMLPQKGVQVLKGPIHVSNPKNDELLEAAESNRTSGDRTARVGLISHIGGHKFAGNVIIYIPPGTKTAHGGAHPLAGCGIWYGRVEPKHVEGIIQATVLDGTVIEDHFRGGIKQGGDILRL
jgi:(2Fe-2S) ferredoxin